MITRPANLLYGVDDTPPLWTTLLLGLQHVGIFAISLILPVIVIKEAGLGLEQATRMVSISMIAAGIGVIAQALRRGPAGSGYLCPQVCGPSYLTASILAAKTGGLSLVFGMTLLTGVFEAAFSRVLRLQFLFPAEVIGLIVAMVRSEAGADPGAGRDGGAFRRVQSGCRDPLPGAGHRVSGPASHPPGIAGGPRCHGSGGGLPGAGATRTR